jgi:beta-lactamase class A
MPEKYSKKKFALTFLVAFSLGVSVGILSLHAISHYKGNNDSEKRISLSSDCCRYTNPLLECEHFQGGDITLDLVKSKLNLYLKNEINKNGVSDIAVYIRDLNNGPWIGLGEKKNFSPGSLLKVPIMIAYFRLAQGDPGILSKTITYSDRIDNPFQPHTPDSLKVGNSYTVEELIRRMIIDSDNVAKELLLKNIDGDDLLRVHRELHLDIPDVRKPADFISLKDYAAFFRILYNATYLNSDMSEKALKLLTETTFKNGIAAGVPADIEIAHKYGIWRPEGNSIQLHDCGIVYYPHAPYLLFVMTKGTDLETLEKIAKDISRIVYEHKLRFRPQ